VTPDTRSARRGLRIALGLTVVFIAVEVAGGVISRSLALLADAGHMVSDAGSLGLSLFAFWLSSRPRSLRRTFGWYRFEIFAALVNGLGLWMVSGIIIWEAYRRFQAPPAVKTGPMLIVAAAGLIANLVSGLVLFRSRGESLNIRSAFLHVGSDAAGSLGVIAGGLIIRRTGWLFVDPLISFLLCGLIVWSSWRLVREAFHVLMEGTPEHLNLGEIQAAIQAVPGVRGSHDLHIWTVTSGFVVLTVHVVLENPGDALGVLEAAQRVLSERFGIRHSTIQVEPVAEPSCPTESCDEHGPAR
jgi:cobalt-zinc-cadmium efflux system protein